MDVQTIDDAVKFAANWLPPIEEEDKVRVMRILTGPEITYGTIFLRKYLQFLAPYTEILGLSGKDNRPREADCAASGIVFFYGCLAYIMHFPNWGQHIEEIFLYDILYVLVDHYIDDIGVSPQTKKEAIAQMYLLIEDPSLHETMELIDPVLKVIAQTYHKLLQRCPAAKPTIIKLFQAEISGLSVQQDGTRSRDDYYSTALNKGGYTMQVLQHIVGDTDPEITKASHHIGTVMQLVDDSVDVLADQAAGIHTIATYDLETKGHLDDLWLDIMQRISQISPKFTLFIMLYTVFTVYLPDRTESAYNEEIRRKVTPLNMFDYHYGCDGSALLVNALMDELAILEAETFLAQD